MTTVEIIDMDNNEQIVNGLFGHSFTIPIVPVIAAVIAAAVIISDFFIIFPP